MLYHNGKWTMAVTCTEEELKRLQAKRAEAIKRAGTRWLLHPANRVKRRTPMPRAGIMLVALFLLGGVGNDFDGHSPATAQAAP